MSRVAAAVALRGVDPPVDSPTQVADHRVRVAETEAGEQLFLLVTNVVAVGVAEPKNVGRARNDDAVAVVHEARDEVEAFEKRALLLKDSGRVRLLENRDLVLRR